jgi:hypothetical protein
MSKIRKALLDTYFPFTAGGVILVLLIISTAMRVEEIGRLMQASDKILLYSSNLEGDWKPEHGITAISASPLALPGAVQAIPEGSSIQVLDCDPLGDESLYLQEIPWERRHELMYRCRVQNFRILITRE